MMAMAGMNNQAVHFFLDCCRRLMPLVHIFVQKAEYILQPDGSFSRRPIIRMCEDSSSDQHLMPVEDEEEWRELNFQLRGSKNGTGSLSLILEIKGPKGIKG